MHKKSSNNNIDAGTGDDLLYLGGTNNNVTGGEGADVFIIGKDNLSNPDIIARMAINFAIITSGY
jgi:Ca2+-binding RTX toxin-like protein